MRSAPARGAIAAFAFAFAFAVAVALGGDAVAGPAQRVVLADEDPELLRAVQTALEPWRFEVIAEAAPPADEHDAEQRAQLRAARFVVWRGEGDLFVWDHARRRRERRASASGPLDPVHAAAAALTVKTLMRLSPLPAPAPVEPVEPVDPAPPSPAPAPAPRGPELRLQVMLAARAARGSETHLGGRAIASALVRPWRHRGWRFGAAVDAGTAAEVKHAGFDGTWLDWAVLGLASWTLARGRWELEPALGGGATRSVLDGELSSSGPRTERALRGLLRAGLTLRARAGAWTVGASVAADAIFAPPSYTKEEPSSAHLFSVPSRTVFFGIVAAFELGAAPG